MNRLIYMLETDPKQCLICRVHRTDLMKWEHITLLDIDRMQDLLKTPIQRLYREEDQTIIPALIQAEVRGWEPPGSLLEGPSGYALLKKMVAARRTFFAQGNHLRIHWGKKLKVSPRWQRQEDGTWRPTFYSEDESVDGFIGTAPPLYFVTGKEKDFLGPVSVKWPEGLGAAWLRTAPLSENAVAGHRLRLRNKFPNEEIPALPEQKAEIIRKLSPIPILTIGHAMNHPTKDSPDSWVDTVEALELHLTFQYGPKEIAEEDEADQIFHQEKGQLIVIPRKKDEEKKAIEQLTEQGLQKTPPEEGFLFATASLQYTLSRQAPTNWHELFTRFFPLWEKAGWIIRMRKGLNITPSHNEDWWSHLEPESSNWYHYSSGLLINGQKVPILPTLLHFLRQNKSKSLEEITEELTHSTFLWSGSNQTAPLVILPGKKLAEIVQILQQMGRNLAANQNGMVKLSPWRARELAADQNWETPDNFPLTLLKKFRQAHAGAIPLDPPVDIPAITTPLRHYQKQTLAWIDFLAATQTHGLLADDMGLGKTLQVLVSLLREKIRGNLSPAALIIAPTGVLGNWRREIQEKTPSLRFYCHHGSNRSPLNKEVIARNDLILTSFGIALLEEEIFKNVTWSFLVVDEAQNLKNPSTKRYQALKKFTAKRRIALSGTPMENHPGEIWALFHFLMPGFLGSKKDFDQNFRQPMESNAQEIARESAQILSQRLRPFMLRRKKEDVAADLPKKSDINHYIALSEEQSRLYEARRSLLHREIRERVEKEGLAASQIFILQAITELRQICCHPGLLPEKSGTCEQEADSAKLNRLLDILAELQSENRQALVFSQFVTMLDLIARECAARQWDFLTYTGATRNRQEVVEQFNTGETPILLISLRAGGTGLNLTAADTVIHYDPWWNPAVEQQATDRAHRIGQDKPVMVHRLIAEDTIEEKILSLHQRKRSLIENLLEGQPTDKILLDESLFA
ncbi:MAG: DEAD/DEAH box helicase [Opitutales bacterium]|nr:DEAD/DEAH box helicase [Opitutales bacterium]